MFIAFSCQALQYISRSPFKNLTAQDFSGWNSPFGSLAPSPSPLLRARFALFKVSCHWASFKKEWNRKARPKSSLTGPMANTPFPFVPCQEGWHQRSILRQPDPRRGHGERRRHLGTAIEQDSTLCARLGTLDVHGQSIPWPPGMISPEPCLRCLLRFCTLQFKELSLVLEYSTSVLMPHRAVIPHSGHLFVRSKNIRRGIREKLHLKCLRRTN